MEIRVHNNGKMRTISCSSFSGAFKQYFQKTSGPKPTGLWYGINDSWHSWCIAEQCEEWIAGNDYEIVVPDLNILKLSDSIGLYNFTNEYLDKERKIGFYDTYYIDWQKVALKYDGIEINPYIWSCRFNDKTSWYYSWDCASGCIWNAQSLKYKLIRRRDNKHLLKEVLQKKYKVSIDN
jgi:hypothetical protein